MQIFLKKFSVVFYDLAPKEKNVCLLVPGQKNSKAKFFALQNSSIGHSA